MSATADQKPSLVRRLARFLRRHGGAAAGAGILIVLSFPPVSLGPAVILGCALLLAGVQGRGYRTGLVRGYLCGLVVEAGGFYWIAGTASRFSGQPFMVGMLIFIAWWLLSSVMWAVWGGLIAARLGFPSKDPEETMTPSDT